MPVYRRIRVIDIITNEYKDFDMVKQAALHYSIDRTLFQKYLKGKYKSLIHSRYKCEYLN